MLFYHYGLAALLSLLACTPSHPDSVAAKVLITNNMPTRDQLMSNWRQNRQILIVYASLNPETAARYEQLAQQMRVRARYATLEVKPCSAVTPEDWRSKAILLIGTQQSNALLQRIWADIPMQLNNNAIVFDNQIYSNETTVAMLSFYPNPLYRNLPLSIVAGLSDEALLRFLSFKIEEGWRIFGWSSWNYEVYQQQKRLLLGMLHPETWAVDKKVHFDFSGSDAPVAESGNMQFIAHYNNAKKSDIQNFEKEITATTDSLRRFINPNATLPPIRYHLYASAEEKALMLNNPAQAHADFAAQEVHAVFSETYRYNQIGKENELIIRHLLGEPKLLALEQGLAIRFAPQWQFKGYQHWAQRLFTSNNLLSISDLLNNTMLTQESPLVTGCLAASFVDFLIEHWGRETFLEKYANWQPNNLEINALEKEWRISLAQYPTVAKSAAPELPYLKGFNFAHEGYAIYNGYMSKLATQSIDKQANTLHCNALSIVPYSYMDAPDQPSFIPIANSAGDENDEGVIHSALAAKAQGMAVMLKPQLWMGRGRWPGDVAMTTEADWQRFFEYYHRWLRHYTLLAEIWGIDLVCIGTELAKTTKTREQDWRALIRKLRGLYSGKLTYAANWGPEFEQLPFWDALDYAGVDCYYPLSDKPDATKADLNTGFQKVLQKLETVQRKAGKPLIFTEIGFKSVQSPWLNPHEASGNAPYLGEHQRLCYEVVFENIHDKPWIRGIFWWKYPSYLDFRGAENDDFNPNRKPAEQVVQQWFAKMP